MLVTDQFDWWHGASPPFERVSMCSNVLNGFALLILLFNQHIPIIEANI